jgi:hypothetical protein
VNYTVYLFSTQRDLEAEREAIAYLWQFADAGAVWSSLHR